MLDPQKPQKFTIHWDAFFETAPFDRHGFAIIRWHPVATPVATLLVISY
jgi:hypothetical protein